MGVPHEKSIDLTGTVLADRYTLRERIGVVGMGTVYVAEEPGGGRVAVKVLDRDKAGDTVLRERFLREIDVATSLTHPNVAALRSFGQLPDGAPFLVLELLEGETLGTRLRRESRLDEATALGFAREAAAGLGAAHQAGVVHRDVKPDNLFLACGPDGTHQLKVLDFGLAKLREGSLTALGLAVGTLAYMAPEQAVSDPVDSRTDVYALGVTLFRMLTGTMPFDAPSGLDMLARHLFAIPRTPSSIVPGISAAADAIVLRSLKKDPARRYATMAALDLALGEALTGQPVEAGEAEGDTYSPTSPFGKATIKRLEARKPRAHSA